MKGLVPLCRGIGNPASACVTGRGPQSESVALHRRCSPAFDGRLTATGARPAPHQAACPRSGRALGADRRSTHPLPRGDGDPMSQVLDRLGSVESDQPVRNNLLLVEACHGGQLVRLPLPGTGVGDLARHGDEEPGIRLRAYPVEQGALPADLDVAFALVEEVELDRAVRAEPVEDEHLGAAPRLQYVRPLLDRVDDGDDPDPDLLATRVVPAHRYEGVQALPWP